MAAACRRASSRRTETPAAKRARSSHLMRRYGLDDASYAKLFAAQDGGSAICGSPPARRYLACDHDHLDPDAPPVVVRGLLDFRCNSAISLLRDRPLFVLNAALYLLVALLAFAKRSDNPKAHPRMMPPAEIAAARMRLTQIARTLTKLERLCA